MQPYPEDVERGSPRRIDHDQYEESLETTVDQEQHALLSPSNTRPYAPDHAIGDSPGVINEKSPYILAPRRLDLSVRWSSVLSLGAAFLAGFAACFTFQIYSMTSNPSHFESGMAGTAEDLAMGASSSAFHFPPTEPTNWDPSLFPTNVGFRGPIATGNEAALVATAPAYPVHTGAPQLIGPSSLGGAKSSGKSGTFDIFRHWGNLRYASVTSAENDHSI